MPGKKRPGDRREANGANLRHPEQEALKAAEPTVVHESEWVDRASLAPRLRRILDLPCWPDVELQLMAGMPLHDLSRYIHEERKEAQWLSRRALYNYLGELRAAAPLPLRVAGFGAVRGEALHRRWGGRAALLEVLWNQVEELTIKLERAYAREQLTGVDNPDVLKMVGTLAQVVVHAHQIQKDLGMVSDRPPEAHGISVELVQRVRMVAGEEAAAALMDPASQGRVLEALRRATQAAGLPGVGLDEAVDYQYGAAAEETAEP